MNLSHALQQSGVIASMASELGIDEQTARAGAGALLPAIVAGMGRQNTAAPGASGLGGLSDILGRALGDQAGGLGGGLLDAVLGQAPTPVKPGNDILGQIFGSKDVSRGVAEEVAGSTGISSDLLKRMLPILAMAVVGYMMNKRGIAEGPATAKGGSAGDGGVPGGALGNLLTRVVAGMMQR